MKTITKIKEDHHDIFAGDETGKVRMIFHTPSTTDPTFRENLKSLLVNDKNITTLIKESMTEVVSDDAAEEVDEFEFIISSSMKPEDKIHNYLMKTNNDIDLSLDDIARYIYEELKL